MAFLVDLFHEEVKVGSFVYLERVSCEACACSFVHLSHKDCCCQPNDFSFLLNVTNIT